MNRFTFAALAAAISLSACGTTDYIGTSPVAFAHDGRNYRVYDMPDENRLMITPSIGESATYHLRKSSWAKPELLFSDAAQAFIAPRGCQVTNVKLLVSPQFEITYSC